MSSYIPQEIILNILSRLQVKSLLRFRCVCKSWSKLLSSNNNDFVKMHLDHALDENNRKNNCSLMINHSGYLYAIDSFSSSSSVSCCCKAVNLDIPFKSKLSFEIWGSCNGLVCSAPDCTGTFFIWNPSTKEYGKISPPPITSQYRNVEYGFGYDSKIDDYKLVTIVSFPSDDVNLDVNVYTLGSKSWRNVQSNFHNPFSAKQAAGVILNGALHWITRTIPHRFQVIVSFNIGDERFQEIELPSCLLGKWTSNVSVFRGNLCILGHMRDSHDVWAMKDYGVIESWTKLFSITRGPSILYLKPIYSFNNGEILFQVRLNEKNEHNALVSYDPNHERATILKIRGSPPICFDDMYIYVGSLVSPNRVLLSGLKEKL